MHTITTTAVATPEHTITVKVPEDIPLGEYPLLIIVGHEKGVRTGRWRDLKPSDVELVDPNFTFRREDLYGDDGR